MNKTHIILNTSKTIRKDKQMKTRISFSVLFIMLVSIVLTQSANATSQWARRTGMSCNSCHTVFPRLNSFGEEFLRNGYQLESDRYEPNVGDIWVDKVSNLLGFRLNVTPAMIETNSFQKDSGATKENKLTLGNTNWIQFFVAGPIAKDISFFSELEFASSSFKFSWFYFNFTNVLGTEKLNFQVGNISPTEFTSYPDRLGQMSALKGEVFHIKSSNGIGENSTKTRDGHGGIQYFGKHDIALWYAGISPGKSATSISQYNEYWGGLVLKMPSSDFEGSTATLHYHVGTDTKNTGIQVPELKQIANSWNRVIPSINLRYKDKVDVQAAYLLATDENWNLVTTPDKEFKYSGIAIDGGFMPYDNWHLGLHFDKYASDDKITKSTDPNFNKPVFEYQRIVPVVTYIVNQNIRFSTYYEKNITPERKDTKGLPILLADKIYLNIRVMY